MLDIKHCPHCSTIFKPVGHGGSSILCAKCLLESDGIYLITRRFIRDNKPETVEEISEALEVPRIFVQALVMDGRFDVDGFFPNSQAQEEEKRRRAQVKSLIMDDLHRASGEGHQDHKGDTQDDASHPGFKRSERQDVQEGNRKSYGFGRHH